MEIPGMRVHFTPPPRGPYPRWVGTRATHRACHRRLQHVSLFQECHTDTCYHHGWTKWKWKAYCGDEDAMWKIISLHERGAFRLCMHPQIQESFPSFSNHETCPTRHLHRRSSAIVWVMERKAHSLGEWNLCSYILDDFATQYGHDFGINH